MRRPHRLTAIVAQLLMLQLILLGSGVACTMPGMGSRAAPSMAQMNMAGGSTASMPNGPTSPPSPDHHHAPCSFPWAPGGCQGMVPCAPAAAASAAVILATAPTIRHDVTSPVALAPPSRTTPPELPPPRA